MKERIKIIIKRLPWKRAFEGELKTGSADGLFGASYKKEREPFGAYPMNGDKPDESRSTAPIVEQS
jgi:polar amino acid transport system substrate-binding protein